MSSTVCTFNGGPKHLLEMPVDDNARKMMFPDPGLIDLKKAITITWDLGYPRVKDKQPDPHVYVRVSKDQFVYVDPRNKQ